MAKILIGNIKMPLANNLTTTNAGTAALDAAQGKVLADKIEKNAENVTQLNSNSNNPITSDYFDFSVCQKGAVKCIYDRGYALQTKKAMSANTTYELYILLNDVTKPIIRIDKYVVLRDGIVAQLLIETNGTISITPMVDIPANTYIRLCEVYL